MTFAAILHTVAPAKFGFVDIGDTNADIADLTVWAGEMTRGGMPRTVTVITGWIAASLLRDLEQFKASDGAYSDDATAEDLFRDHVEDALAYFTAPPVPAEMPDHALASEIESMSAVWDTVSGEGHPEMISRYKALRAELQRRGIP